MQIHFACAACDVINNNEPPVATLMSKLPSGGRNLSNYNMNEHSWIKQRKVKKIIIERNNNNNVAQCNYTRQCWPAVSVTYRMWGEPRPFQGPSIFTAALLRRSSHFACMAFACACVEAFLLPALPSLWVGLGKYLKTFHWGSQCDGAW